MQDIWHKKLKKSTSGLRFLSKKNNIILNHIPMVILCNQKYVLSEIANYKNWPYLIDLILYTNPAFLHFYKFSTYFTRPKYFHQLIQ